MNREKKPVNAMSKKKKQRVTREKNRAPDTKGGQGFLKEGVVDGGFTMDQSCE